MDSSNNERGAPKEAFPQPSSSPPPPPMAMAPPHNAYYPPGMPAYPGQGPPGMGYPGYGPPGYDPYPNQVYAQPQGYYPAPAPQYYNAPPPAYQNGYNRGKAFIRGFICCSCLIFTALFVSTILIALVMHPQPPVYMLNSLSVANFNATSTLVGDWNTSITVENNNERLRGLFSNFKVDLFYKNDIVAMSYVPNFVLEKKENRQFDMRPSSGGLFFTEEVLDEIANERARGSITLSARVSSMVSFRSNSMSTRNTLILAVCNDLKVVFQGNSSVGALENAGGPIGCQLYM